MSRLIDVPNGDRVDIVRLCEAHGWASPYHPKELAITPRECPTCEDYDGEAGRARYRALTARGLVADTYAGRYTRQASCCVPSPGRRTA